jgi:protein subunit release factor A
MWDALKNVEDRFQELTRLLSDPAVASDPRKLRDLSKERAQLEPTIRTLEGYRAVDRTLADDRAAIDSGDPELAELARAEMPELEAKRASLEQELQKLLVPRDPDDDKNVIVEIRAGTGGAEASLFASDLYRMYTKHAEQKGWKQEVLSTSPSEVGGFKEMIFQLSGTDVYREMKFESGVHRVQRVPDTEASGRIHTSAATVAVLPEVERRGHRHPGEGHPRRRVPRGRARRTGSQHHGLGGAHHPPADQPGGDLPGRALADQESREGDEGATRAPLRRQAPGAAGQAGRHGGVAGVDGRSQARRSAPTTSARPGHRPSHQPHPLSLQDVVEGDIQELSDALAAADMAERLAAAGESAK